MKPLQHITVSVWNYCNNSCSYCVSESYRPEWTFSGRFETYSPPGEEYKTDLQLRKKYGNDYYERMCEDKTLLNKHNVLDIAYLVDWLQDWKPGAVVYLSGGEPLLRPDIEAAAEALINAGFIVVMMTNGTLIPKRTKLLELPIVWFLAHHQDNPVEKWIDAVSAVADKPHIATAVKVYDMYNHPERYEPHYKHLNFHWRVGKGGFVGKKLSGPSKQVATNFINLITPDGAVYPCNSKAWGPMGHVYDGSFHPERVPAADEHVKQCVRASHCGAYQSALMIERLLEDQLPFIS